MYLAQTLKKMTTRLTKNEWQQKIVEYYSDVLGILISQNELRLWWYNHTETSDCLRLDERGFQRFKEAKIEFNKYECHVPQWIGSVTVGLSRMLCPYYIEPIQGKPGYYNFYLTDDEYAMLLMFASNDLATFVKGFTKNEVV
jgi:hypothetical protein